MKRNSFAKGTQIRSNKKFNTTVKQNVPLLSSNKSRKSIKTSTKRSNKEEEITSPKPRKSAFVGTVKKTIKKNYLFNKEKDNDLIKSGKRPSTSILKEPISTNRTKSKKISMKSNKSTKRSAELDEKKSKKSTKSKQKQNDKEVDIINSEDNNKNENLDINSLNSENNTHLINSEDNSKANEIKSKINQENEKPNGNVSKDNLRESQNKNQSKKNSLKENNISINNKMKNEYLLNQPLNINLVKEINEKPNYRYESKYDVNKNDIEEQEDRLRNHKIESSDYITEKNKNMMRKLLYLLDRKPDDKKSSKNFFRSSLNALNIQERNKLLDVLAKTKNEIFRIKYDEKMSKINENLANKKLSEIYHVLFEKNHRKNNFDQSWDTYQPQYCYREKYFFNYVNDLHPNLDKFLGNNLSNPKNNKLSQSYDNTNFNFMGKNNLLIEKRNDKYLKYDYDYLMNSIDYKLNKDYREIYRRKRMEKMVEHINDNIYAMSPQKYFGRNSFSEIKRNSLFF